MAHTWEIFRWTDRDEDFFGLFVRVDEIVEEDSLLIRVIEEIFLALYPKDNLIIKQDFFDVLALLEMHIVSIHFQSTTIWIELRFVIVILLLHQLATWLGS